MAPVSDAPRAPLFAGRAGRRGGADAGASETWGTTRGAMDVAEGEITTGGVASGGEVASKTSDGSTGEGIATELC